MPLNKSNLKVGDLSRSQTFVIILEIHGLFDSRCQGGSRDFEKWWRFMSATMVGRRKKS